MASNTITFAGIISKSIEDDNEMILNEMILMEMQRIMMESSERTAESQSMVRSSVDCESHSALFDDVGGCGDTAFDELRATVFAANQSSMHR